MKMDIRARGMHVAGEFRNHAKRRMHFALARFGGRIASVRVTVSDQNGPRGGVDKRCQVAVRLLPRGELVLSDSDASLHAALDRTADRLGRQVARALERRSWSRAVPVLAAEES